MDDVGTSEESADYPVDARVVAKKVVSAPGQVGILACGTGMAMAMIANRICVMRAALGQDSMTRRLAREHNDANVLALGGRVGDDVGPSKSCAIL